MINELVYFFTVFLYFGVVLVLYKLLGKNGIYIYSIFASLLSCVADGRCISVFGLPTYPGTVFYASVYLATDILSEKYGKKEARNAVIYGLVAMILWVLGTQTTLMFVPNEHDYLGNKLNEVLGMTPRIFIASMIAYICSQTFDVFMYHFIWERTGNNKAMLWVRNNVATCLSQAIDTLTMSAGLVLFGVYPLKTALGFTLGKYVMKVIIALLDTPFAYLARSLNKNKKVASAISNSACENEECGVPA